MVVLYKVLVYTKLFVFSLYGVYRMYKVIAMFKFQNHFPINHVLSSLVFKVLFWVCVAITMSGCRGNKRLMSHDYSISNQTDTNLLLSSN